MGFTLKKMIPNGQACLMKISPFNISFLINKCKFQEAKYLANESSVMMYRHFYIIMIQIKIKTKNWTDGSALKGQSHNQNYKTQVQKVILIIPCWISRVPNLTKKFKLHRTHQLPFYPCSASITGNSFLHFAKIQTKFSPSKTEK